MGYAWVKCMTWVVVETMDVNKEEGAEYFYMVCVVWSRRFDSHSLHEDIKYVTITTTISIYSSISVVMFLVP